MRKIYRDLLGITLATVITGLALITPVNAAEPVHKVRPGESLWSIAREHKLDVATLAKLNGIKNSSYIEVGMELKISSSSVTYKVKSGDTLWLISKRFGVSYQNIITYNNLKNPNQIVPGMTIKIPTKTKVVQPRFIWPAQGRISSYYGPRWGRMHSGIDIALPIGRNVVAAAAGRVVWGGWVSGYGQTVIIEHQNGYRTLYAHNDRALVKGGDWVKQGQLIAKSGNTGRSTGPHLHFEIQKDGKAQDPMRYLR